jgi:tetratricopeptide (TPR) repeat protein
MREINSRRALEESKARQQVADGKTLCITPFGIDVVGITQTVALVGAIGAGLTSNARKAEIAELNEKLRAVNQTLRAQVRPSGPGGAPQVVFPDGGVGGPSSKGGSKGGEGPSSSNEASSDEASANDDPSQTAGASPLDSLDLEDELARAAHAQRVASGESSEESFPAESESQAETKRALRDGRALLKEDAPGAYRRAQEKFELALTMARMLGDRVQMRRATRGISASRRGLGDGKGAIEGLKRVLEISKEIGDYTGDTDALGAIADIYTEIGDLENAGKYYDLYLDALNDEMNVN